MLQKLTLHNFQNHKVLRVPIDPLVTTIVGGSDVGKSAVARALRWLCFNRPAGDAFIRDGSKEVTVKLTVDDKTIRRSKGPGLNEYKLDEQVFTAFGSGLPEDIGYVLQVALLNFQNQHDGPFWLCETPGEISRQMNSVVNLSAMDDAMASITSAVRKSCTATEIYDSQVATAKEELDSFAYLEALDDQLESLERTRANLFDNMHKANLADELIKRVQVAAVAKEVATSRLSATEKVAKRAADLRKLASEREGLENLVTAARAQRQLRATDLSSWAAISRVWGKLATAKDAAAALANLIDRAQTEKRNRTKRIQEAEAANQNLQEQSEGVCPLCRQPITQ